MTSTVFKLNVRTRTLTYLDWLTHLLNRLSQIQATNHVSTSIVHTILPCSFGKCPNLILFQCSILSSTHHTCHCQIQLVLELQRPSLMQTHIDIPQEIWLKVGQFVPDKDLRSLLDVNYVFFNLAMDVRYRNIIFHIDERTMKMLQRLK